MTMHSLALCTQKELKTLYGISVSRMTLWRWELQGRFPKRVVRGFRVYYYRLQVEGWLRDARWTSVHSEIAFSG